MRRALEACLGVLLASSCAYPDGYDRAGPGIAGSTGTSTGTGTGTGTITDTGTGTCDVPCTGRPPVGYEDNLVMVWWGKPGEARACPAWAPEVGFVGYNGPLTPPHTCPGCTCSSPSCAPPVAMEVAAAACVDAANSPKTPTAVPAGWDGACTTEGAIPDLQCSGPLCSLTVDPAPIDPCVAAPSGPMPPLPEAVWGQMAVACLLGPLETLDCPHGQLCAPAPEAGFAICAALRSDEPVGCPTGKQRLVFYDATKDTRACTPCICGPPSGTCSVLVSVYSDATCDPGTTLGSVTSSTNTGPVCVDLPAGAALAGKAAPLVVDEPGTCAHGGGDAVGSLEPAGQVTFCCGPVAPDPR